jgi:hypothetical protein
MTRPKIKPILGDCNEQLLKMVNEIDYQQHNMRYELLSEIQPTFQALTRHVNKIELAVYMLMKRAAATAPLVFENHGEHALLSYRASIAHAIEVCEGMVGVRGVRQYFKNYPGAAHAIKEAGMLPMKYIDREVMPTTNDKQMRSNASGI